MNFAQFHGKTTGYHPGTTICCGCIDRRKRKMLYSNHIKLRHKAAILGGEKMKRLLVVWMAAVMLVYTLAGCGAKTPDGGGAQSDSSVVNLMDMYSVEDPEGVEYDQRTALYMPVLESDELYASGARHVFSVYYGKEGKGVYLYAVTIFDSEESASAYQESVGAGEVDGTAHIGTSDADFFTAMESFIPDLQTWIDNSMASGMIEVE